MIPTSMLRDETHKACNFRIAELERENAELRRDAERINYLEASPLMPRLHLYGITVNSDISLREAIDDAMKEAKP